MLDQRLPSSSRVPYSLNGERWLSKALDSPIDGRTRESGKTGDAGNTPSSQLLCIDGSDKVLLSLIQVRKQQAVFLLEFFCCAHTDSVTQWASFVTIINLRALIEGNPAIVSSPGLASGFADSFSEVVLQARPRSWERSSQATTMLGRGIVTRSLARVDDPEIMGEKEIRSSSTPLDYFLVRADLGSF